MKYTNKEIVEVVGVIAVVASLIFVGVQLYLDRKVALSDQYANRAESLKADLRARLESDAWMARADELWNAGERPPFWNPELEAEAISRGIGGSELEAETMTTRITLIHRDNLYYQHQQGFIESEFIERIRENYRIRLLTFSPITQEIIKIYGQALADGPIIREVLGDAGNYPE